MKRRPRRTNWWVRLALSRPSWLSRNSARSTTPPSWINHHVLDVLAFPGVREVHAPIVRLNHRRIRMLTWRRFDDERRMPGGTVFRNRDLERVARGSARIVDKEESPIGEPDGVDARTWVGQRRCRHPSPRTAAVIRSRLCDDALSAATQDLKRRCRVSEKRWLNGAELGRCVQRRGAFPRPRIGDALSRPGAGKPLHVRERPSRRSRTGAGQHHARGYLHRLCANRTEDSPRQRDRIRPRASRVGRRARKPPPLTWTRTNLVEQHERTVRRLEQHGIPARVPCRPAARRWRPPPAPTTRHPDGAPPKCRRQDSFPAFHRTTPRRARHGSRLSSRRAPMETARPRTRTRTGRWPVPPSRVRTREGQSP